MINHNFLPVRVNNIHLTINQKTCLNEVNFTVNDKGITVIVGSNGSGKTLLLKLLAGVIQATKGSIDWHKQPQPPTLTMVPAKAVLLNRSVSANIELPLHHKANRENNKKAQEKNHHADKSIVENTAENVIEKTVKNITEDALAWADIDYLKHRQAKNLSTGEQQLVALARAWALKPKVLLLDEITANLDPSRTKKMNTLIQDLSSSCKIILTTHSMKQANLLANDILLLERGNVLIHAETDEFFKSNELQHFLSIT